MLERQDLLDGDLPVGRLVESSNDGAICASTESVEDLVIVTWKGERKQCQSGS